MSKQKHSVLLKHLEICLSNLKQPKRFPLKPISIWLNRRPDDGIGMEVISRKPQKIFLQILWRENFKYCGNLCSFDYAEGQSKDLTSLTRR